MVKPLKHQKEILSELEGKDKALIHSASGSGKTHSVFFEILKVKPKSFLYVVHRNEILWQSVKIFKEICPFANDDNIGIINHQHKEPYKQYLFSTVQTISKDRNLRTINPYIEYLIVDEFHHSAAPTYQKVIKHFKACKVRGLTATPNRMDKQDIMKQVDNVSVGNIDIFDGIKRGIMVPFNYIGLWDNIDWSDVHTWNGYRYKQNDLDKKLLVDERDKQVITEYKQRIEPENRLTIGFCATIKHVKRMTEKFNAAGIKAEGIFYNENLGKRAKILEQFRKGEINVIFTRDILNEGVDFPECEALMFLRPTHSEVIFKQQLGRGLRKRRGKKNVLVLDFISNYEKAYQTKAYLKDIVRGPHIPIEPGKYYKPEYLMRVPTYAFESKVIDTMELQERMQKRWKYTYQELCDNYEEVEKKLGKRPSAGDLNNNKISKISSTAYTTYFGPWYNVVKHFNPDQIDIKNPDKSYKTEFLIKNYMNFKQKLGRIPRVGDMRRRSEINKVTSETYKQHFGLTWNDFVILMGDKPAGKAYKRYKLDLKDLQKKYRETIKENGLNENRPITVKQWKDIHGTGTDIHKLKNDLDMTWTDFTKIMTENKFTLKCAYCGNNTIMNFTKNHPRKYCSVNCRNQASNIRDRESRKKNIDF